MINWILSKLFPVKKPIYHVHRRETKMIPVMTSSQAWAHYLHMHKGISTAGMSAAQVRKELGDPYTREFRFRNAVVYGGSK